MTPVTNSTSAAGSSAPNLAALGGGLGLGATGDTQDRFLKLLVTQLQNQDPLNPLQNSEITSQLAQLSTVDGINKLSSLVGNLSNAFNATQSLQAAGLIGHGVLTPGNTLNLTQGNAQGAVQLPQAVDELSITIRDASGAIVHTANLGAQSGGIVRFQWDGVGDNGSTQPAGSYRYEVKGIAAGQAVANVKPLSHGVVGSVTLGAQGTQLNLDGQGSVGLSDVSQIL